MKKWLKIERHTIFRDTSKGGLLSQFLTSYKAEFGGSINPSCRKCLNQYHQKFLKKYTTMEKKQAHGFELKAKYNGIKSKVTGRPYRNDDLTEKQAIELIEKHPHGANLFDKIPKTYYESLKVLAKVVKPAKKRRRKTLKANK